MEEELIEMLKEEGVKSKDIKKVLHAFDTLNDVAFDSHTDIEQFFAMYEISRYP